VTIPEVQLLGAAALIFIPLEWLLPLHRDKKILRPGLGTDALHVIVSGALIHAGTAATGLTLSYACALTVPDRVQNAIHSQPSWLQFVLLLLLADLCFYLAHRLVHAVPWLWRFHAVHHSSEQMDWLATFRVHPVDQTLNSTIIALPIVALGFSPAPLLAYALLYRVHALLLHSNVHVDLGPLGRVFASPRYHHWHHADEPQAYDRNFGGQLVIWDLLFDTLYESDELPARYGVGGAVPSGYLQQLLTPLLPKRRRRAHPTDRLRPHSSPRPVVPTLPSPSSASAAATD
jgi:sterol desaturase/sphingolipid hydroxylase (fatty acid hydroxylase superfamily)